MKAIEPAHAEVNWHFGVISGDLLHGFSNQRGFTYTGISCHQYLLQASILDTCKRRL